MMILAYKSKQFRSNRLTSWINSLKGLSRLFAVLVAAMPVWVAAEEPQSRQPSERTETLSSPSESHMVDLQSMPLLQQRKCTADQGDEGGDGDDSRVSDPPRPQFTKQQAERFSCLASVREIHDGWIRNKNLLIDVRRPERFSKYAIAGSLNVPAFAIKSKGFWSDKSLVLVNDGRSLSQLEGLCHRLKSKGFKQVSVMEGGLYAWHKAGFPIAGDALEISRMNRMSPSEWMSASREREWRFIDLDRSLPTLAKLLPSSEIIDYQTDKRAFLTAINQANRSFPKGVLTGFLVVGENGDGYDAIEPLLSLSEAKNVFYLSGGTSEFASFLSRLASQMSRLAKGFKETHRCSG